MKKYKKLVGKNRTRIINRVNLLLAAGLDWCKNTNKGEEYWFSPVNPYYSEAFGIMQALECLEYGYFGPDFNFESEFNLKFWFNQLKAKVKVIGEENGEYETYAFFKKISNEIC